MSDAKINWYSIGLNQKVEEHEPVDLQEALGIADRYLARGNEKFENSEKAIAATMFGFSKSKHDFIEICVNGPRQISYKFEFSGSASGSQKLFSRAVQYEDELHSKDELAKKVAEFFNNPSEEIAGQYEGTKKQTKSPLLIPAGASIGTRIFTIAFLSIVGLGALFITTHGIFTGRIWSGSRYQTGKEILLNQNPTLFWMLVAFYAGIGIWLVRGCILELLIVQKMLSGHKKSK